MKLTLEFNLPAEKDQANEALHVTHAWAALRQIDEALRFASRNGTAVDAADLRQVSLRALEYIDV